MKLYIRVLSFGKSYIYFLPQYILFTLLGVVFGAVNLTMIAPILKALDSAQIHTGIAPQMPEFEWAFSYFTSLFYYGFDFVTAQYGKVATLQYVCLILIVSVFLANLFRYMGLRIINHLRVTAIQNIRSHTFERLIALDSGYFTNARKGDLMSRMTNDIQEIETYVLNTLKTIIKEPLTILVYFIILFYTSFELTLFTLIFLPVTGGIISEISKRLRRKGIKSQELLATILGIVDESLNGLKIIEAFNARPYILGKFNHTNQAHAHTNASILNRQDIASPLSEFLGVGVVAGILLYGGTLVLKNPNGDLTAETFMMYIAVFSQIMPSIKALSRFITNLQRGLAAADRVLQIVDTKPKIQDKPHAIRVENFEEKIEFKNVFFAYEEKDVLQNINLQIRKGEMVALVGQSGGGKSTLADMLARFYDPKAGNITLDGTDLRDFELESFRQQIGLVSQEAILFNDTIFNNIAFGLENISEDKVMEAAKIANAHEFILQTEKGYQTNIGDKGTKLSGGQRQRISIARAVLKNPPLLILDEATSALDSESEKAVQKALTNLMQNRTSVVIAHRLSTIREADRIVVLQDGKIKEEGTHQELMEQNGLYTKLVEMQNVK